MIDVLRQATVQGKVEKTLNAMAVLWLLLVVTQVTLSSSLNLTDHDVRKLVQNLQEELSVLKQAQQEDKQLILQLQEKLSIRHYHQRRIKPSAVPHTTPPPVPLADTHTRRARITVDELERERMNIIKLENEISDLKKDFLQILSEQETQAALNVKLEEYRQDIILLQDQFKESNLEIIKLKEVHEKSAVSPVNQLKFYNTGIKFLQKRVDDLRTEVLAFSEAHNSSATQGQIHHLQSTINRLRMDLLSLQNNFEELTTTQEHDLSTVIYLQRELSEIGQQMTRLSQSVAINQQDIIQLKENISLHILIHNNELNMHKRRNIEEDEKEKKSEEESKFINTTTVPELDTTLYTDISLTPGIKSEVDYMRTQILEEQTTPLTTNLSTNESIPDVLPVLLTTNIATTTVYPNHNNGELKTVKHRRELQQEIHQLKKELENLNHDFQLLEIRCTSQGTAIQQHNSAQANLSFQIAELEEKLRYLENRTLENVRQEHFQSIVRNVIVQLAAIDQQELDNELLLTNITIRISNLEKLNAQFTTLNDKVFSIEEEYSDSISSLQRNMDSVEYTISQMKGIDNNKETVQEVKQEVLGLQTKITQFGYKLTTLQNNVLNSSLQSCKDENRNLLRDTKLSNLEMLARKHGEKIEKYDSLFPQIRNAMNFKVDVNSMKQLVMKAEQLEDRLDNTTKELPVFTEHIQVIKHEIFKFIQQLPQDCMMHIPFEAALYHSGTYLIHPENSITAYEVFCDMDHDEGWTVIQRRLDGSEDFFRTWEEYKIGFGKVQGEYWLGNDIIYLLTNQDNYTLLIQMWDTNNEYTWAKYDSFRIANESENYRITVAGYDGNSSDALEYHNNMFFSTKDHDNDASSSHCAMFYAGGWWYSHCQYSNLNGDYKIGITWYDKEIHEWRQMKKVLMKIRPFKSCGREGCR